MRLVKSHPPLDLIHSRHVLRFALALLAALLLPAMAPRESDAGIGVCSAAVRTISYDVVAFQTVIPVNGWGDHIPDGYMYALSNADASPNQAAILANPNLASPLVLRAAEGDCVRVNFKNEIAGRRVGMHVDGVSRDPADSDGARIGRNPDSTVAPDGSTTYYWYAHREGQFLINDYGSGTNYQMTVGGTVQPDTTSRGLYGGLIVEPAGSTWHDQITGQNLLDASNRGLRAPLFADVRVPGPGNDFRDYAIVLMDESEDVLDREGKPATYPATGLADSTFGFNYRSEPLRNRLRAVLEHRAGKVVTLPNGTVIQPTDPFCDGYVPELGQAVQDPGAQCVGEEFHLQSWPFGDEGKLTRKLADGTIVVDTDNLILKAYVGDPVHVRLFHPGIKETHPFHQHTNRWLLEPKDPNSPRLDVQSIGPGQTFDLFYEGGAGQLMGTPGDQIFHCHLYPHFAQGIWGHLRVFDRLRRTEYNQKYPDNTPIEQLMELPDRAGAIQAPDAMHPGFPLFVKGDYLQKAYRPPYAVVTDPFQSQRRPGDTVRTGTDLERANMALKPDGAANPGVFFVEPCPAGAPERTYNPAAIDANLVYNKAGWHDPNGKLYVEAPPEAGKTALQKADEVRNAINRGDIQAEPYTIRSRMGECVNLRTTNATHMDNDPNLPRDVHGGPTGDTFHESTPMTELTTHVHLVRFDQLGTDGTSVGWNYVQGPLIGQTYGYRWFVDVPLRTVFFHDHQFPTTHQQHGLWSAMNVEPHDATWHDPRTGAQTNGVGTVADIRTPSGPDFREFTIHYSDFVPQVDAAGNPINAPAHPDQYAADQGVMGINYRNEPFPTRVNSASTGAKAEPAYVFSSAVHGDPSTPLFRAYPGDPVVFRLMNGAHEELHNFNLAGHRWLGAPDDPNSNLVDTSPSAGIGEWFNFEIQGNQVVKRGVGRKKADQHTRLSLGATLIPSSGAGAPGDYLYSSRTLNDLWIGLWGIMRVPARVVPDLQPLPDRQAPPAAGQTGPGDEWPALKPGEAIRPAPEGGALDPCPATAPVKVFKVSILQQRIDYNQAGDHDPNGVLYALESDLDSSGKPKAGTGVEPLFVRANEGDCVEIRFRNRLPAAGIPMHAGDAANPVENVAVGNLVSGAPVSVQATWPAGNRGSVHMAGISRYEVTRGDGSAVGYNYDSTIAPGGYTVYRFYLDTTGVIGIENLANVRGTRHHGGWAALIAEPRGAEYLNPKDGSLLESGAAAVIRYPFTNPNGSTTMKSFREFVVDLQDGLNLLRKDGTQVDDQASPHGGPAELPDPEDQGDRGVNYRSERFQNRLARDPQIANVFSSTVHGDPATPVFRAYVGDPVVMRVLNSQDQPRSHTFGLFGHEWPREPNDPNTSVVNAEGEFNVGRALNLHLIGGAGGLQKAAGDYLYNDRNLFHFLSGGIWGLIRVHAGPQPDLRPLP